MRPRLRRSLDLGWICRDANATGSGRTPRHAYRDWLNVIALRRAREQSELSWRLPAEYGQLFGRRADDKPVLNLLQRWADVLDQQERLEQR